MPADGGTNSGHRHPVAPGTELAGRWLLESLLSESEHAAVWKATDLRLLRPVIVKLGGPALEGSPLGLTRFARTARSAATVLHPNVVRVLDYSATGHPPYLVLEPSGVHTLAESVDDRSPSAAEIEALFVKLRGAVASLHEHGVIHGALTADNVLLGDHGELQLTAFAFAFARADDESGGQVASFETDLRLLARTFTDLIGDTSVPPGLSEAVAQLQRPAGANRPVAAARRAGAAQDSHAATGGHRRPVPGFVTAAAATAAAVVAGIALATSGATTAPRAGHSPSAQLRRPPRAVQVALHHRPTLEQRLSSMTSVVRDAAAPR